MSDGTSTLSISMHSKRCSISLTNMLLPSKVSDMSMTSTGSDCSGANILSCDSKSWNEIRPLHLRVRMFLKFRYVTSTDRYETEYQDLMIDGVTHSIDEITRSARMNDSRWSISTACSCSTMYGRISYPVIDPDSITLVRMMSSVPVCQ